MLSLGTDVFLAFWIASTSSFFFIAGRPARPIPVEKAYLTRQANARFAEEVAAMTGHLLYLDAVTFKQSFQPTRAELEAALRLEVVAQDAVGADRAHTPAAQLGQQRAQVSRRPGCSPVEPHPLRRQRELERGLSATGVRVTTPPR